MCLFSSCVQLACVGFGKRGSRAGEGRQHEDDIVNFVSYPSDTREERSLLKVLLILFVCSHNVSVM